MKRLEAEETFFFLEIGWRDVSFGVMVSVIGFRHVSSRNRRLMLSEREPRIQQGMRRGRTSAAEAAFLEGDVSARLKPCP